MKLTWSEESRSASGFQFGKPGAEKKAGVRGAHEQDTQGAQMRPMAMTLATDEAINDVAAYIATLQ